MEAKELIQFEEEIADLFLDGKIRSPIHLNKGNEEELIELFDDVLEDDWVFSTHRSHYHALLKGIPKDWLRDEILAGRSMHINSREHKFFTSSIVAGVMPIALGVAMAIKRTGGTNRVWVFVGDMAYETGISHEVVKYATGFDLPITFVVEDNNLSVNTPTMETWGLGFVQDVIRLPYERGYPHSGCGQFVEFR